MFYWLDGFTHCLPHFFHHGMGLNPTSCTAFLTFYVDLTKWPNELMGQANVPCLGRSYGPRESGLAASCRPPFGHLYEDVWLVAWRGRACNGLI
jgi:hypothetical protein